MDKSTQSKEAISNSLMQLLKEKEYFKITIQDIVDRAKVSRMAFYRNFNDKDEIIKYYLDNITDNFIKSSKIIYDPNNFSTYIIKLFTHLENNKDIGILLYKANMIHYLKNEFDRIFLSKANSQSEEYHSAFLSGGLYNIYYYWIKNNCKETPKQLSAIFTEFYILKGNSN